MIFPDDPELRRQLLRCGEALSRRWGVRLAETTTMLRDLLNVKTSLSEVADALESDDDLVLAWGEGEGQYPLLVDGQPSGVLGGPPPCWLEAPHPRVYAALMAHAHEPSRNPFIVLGPPWQSENSTR